MLVIIRECKSETCKQSVSGQRPSQAPKISYNRELKEKIRVNP